jgi:citrate synthase
VEAAARLGVKRATLYAYVSRGMITRHVAMDGKTSLFDVDEVEQFRSRRRRTTEGELDAVISTGLTRVADGELWIRGRDLPLMVAAGATFEQVVDWLWAGEGEPWEADQGTLETVARVHERLPHYVSLLDRIRITTAVASGRDQLRFDRSPIGVRRAGRSLLLAMVEGLGETRRRSASGSIAHRLWPRLTLESTTSQRCVALDAALSLLVDHGMAASTLAVRIAASVRADPYSSVIAGLGVVGGPLHGAASSDVHRMLLSAGASGDPAAAVGRAQRNLDRVPGFGHKVYRHEDPRYTALMGSVNHGWRFDARLRIVQAVRDVVGSRTDAIPNVDFALGAMTWLADMPPDAGEAIFAISRTAGWIAHTLEEYEQAPLRFRPRARYTGPRVT